MNGYGSPSNSGPCNANPCGAVQIIQGYAKTFLLNLFYAATGAPYDLTGATQITAGLPAIGATAPVLEVLAPISFTLTATTTILSNVLSALSSLAGITIGMQVSGAGVPVGTIVTQVIPAEGSVPATVTLSNAATATAAGITLSLSTGMTVSTTATTTNLSNQLTGLGAAAGVLVGQLVTGTGIPAGAYVTSVNPVTLAATINVPATASGAPTLTFTLPPQITVTGAPGAGALSVGIPAADSAFLQLNPSTLQNQDLVISVTNLNGTVTAFILPNVLNVVTPDYGVLP